MKRLIAGMLLATTACATTAPDAATAEPSGPCDAAPIQDLVGRPASAELGQDALTRSGSRALRWIRPGDAVTMDFRQDRLNLHLDARGAVERITCG